MNTTGASGDMVALSPLWSGLAVVGCAVLTFLLFFGITVFFSRRRHRRRRLIDESRTSLDECHVYNVLSRETLSSTGASASTVSSSVSIHGPSPSESTDITSCATPAVSCDALAFATRTHANDTPKRTQSSIELTVFKTSPPSRALCKIDLSEATVSLDGVTLDDSVTDEGVLSTRGTVLFQQSQQEQILEELLRWQAEEEEIKASDEKLRQRTLHDWLGSADLDTDDELDPRFITYLQQSLCDNDKQSDTDA